MNARVLLCLLLGLATPASAWASEVDSFTDRYAPHQDATDAINGHTRDLLQKALNDANNSFWGRNCNETYLHFRIWRTFYSITGPFIAFFAEDGPLDAIQPEIDDTIYADLSATDSFVLGGLGEVHNFMGTTFQFGDYYLGSDKFEHVWGYGFPFYVVHHKWRFPLHIILWLNWMTEKYIFGAVTTAVHSYADMAVNFEGMRMFNTLLGRYRDVISSTYPEPIILCEDNEWKLNPNKSFDWRDHVTAAWDEGINCSEFRTESATQSIVSNISRLEEDGREYSCSLDPDALAEARESLGPVGSFLTNDSHTTLGR